MLPARAGNARTGRGPVAWLLMPSASSAHSSPTGFIGVIRVSALGKFEGLKVNSAPYVLLLTFYCIGVIPLWLVQVMSTRVGWEIQCPEEEVT